MLKSELIRTLVCWSLSTFAGMQDRKKRQRLVSATIAFLQDTALAPQGAERHLLNLFIDGSLTINQVLAELEALNQANAFGQLPTYLATVLFEMPRSLLMA